MMQFIWQITNRLHCNLSAPLEWLEQIEQQSDAAGCHCRSGNNSFAELSRLLRGLHEVLEEQADSLLFLQNHLFPRLGATGQGALVQSLQAEQRRLTGLNISIQGLTAAPARLANNLNHWDELVTLSEQLHLGLLRYLQRLEMDCFPLIEQQLDSLQDERLVRTFAAITDARPSPDKLTADLCAPVIPDCPTRAPLLHRYEIPAQAGS